MKQMYVMNTWLKKTVLPYTDSRRLQQCRKTMENSGPLKCFNHILWVYTYTYQHVETVLPRVMIPLPDSYRAYPISSREACQREDIMLACVIRCPCIELAQALDIHRWGETRGNPRQSGCWHRWLSIVSGKETHEVISPLLFPGCCGRWDFFVLLCWIRTPLTVGCTTSWRFFLWSWPWLWGGILSLYVTVKMNTA